VFFLNGGLLPEKMCCQCSPQEQLNSVIEKVFQDSLTRRKKGQIELWRHTEVEAQESVRKKINFVPFRCRQKS
jgi:hypothetical protein